MSNKLYCPQVDHFISCYGNRSHNGMDNGTTYDKQSYEIIDKIFDLIKQLTPISENGCRELWFCAERGPIEAFGNYEQWLEEGEVKDYKEFEDTWKAYYPKAKKWYRFQAVEDEKSEYRIIALNHKFVIEIHKDSKKGFEHKITKYVQWIYDSIKERIKDIKAGTYMDEIRMGIPPEHKTGTILQKELWDIFPDYKDEIFQGLTETDINDFINYLEIQNEEGYVPQETLKDITANDFYKYCSMGYAAMGYNKCNGTPKEQYEVYADGRDDGLSELDADSPTEFSKWLFDRRMKGGHPWEVCRGGNSTHISLYVENKDGNYILHLAGSAYYRTNETIKFYLALRRNGLPVVLRDSKEILQRVLGTEKVGIVPQGIIPKYRYADFPNEHIISFMNLPYEDTERVAEKCIWQDIREVKLLEGSETK